MKNAATRNNLEVRRRPEWHPNQRQLTPPYILNPVRRVFGGVIDLDPCTEPDNPTEAERFYCLPQDGCALPWNTQTIFCNPPYGEVRDRWVKRCIAAGREGKQVILLIPSATDSRTFQLAFGHCTTAVFVAGRLKFGQVRKNGRQEAASHPSTLFGYNVDLSTTGLGVCSKPVPPRVALA